MSTWENGQRKAKKETPVLFQVGMEVAIYKTGVIDRISWDCVDNKWTYHVDLGKDGSAEVHDTAIENVEVTK